MRQLQPGPQAVRITTAFPLDPAVVCLSAVPRPAPASKLIRIAHESCSTATLTGSAVKCTGMRERPGPQAVRITTAFPLDPAVVCLSAVPRPAPASKLIRIAHDIYATREIAVLAWFESAGAQQCSFCNTHFRSAPDRFRVIDCVPTLSHGDPRDPDDPGVTWLSSRRGNRWGARCEGKKGQVVRGLARDDEARKLCPKGLELWRSE